MGSFAQDRRWAIEKKNDAYIKAEELNEKAENLTEKKENIEEGISRIPTDLPDELQQQIDAAIENARSEISHEMESLADTAKEAQDDADENIDTMRNVSDDYKEKAARLKALSGIPLIGSFAETKGEELDDQAEQMVDLSQETQQYSDKLAEARRKLTNI